MSDNNFNWPPLESDPQIFSDYIQSIGADSSISFQEIYSLDYKEMQVIESPVYAVVISYERAVPYQWNQNNFKESNYVPFYMKQTEVLDNACGLIAMLHSVGNNLENLSIQENSVLSNLYLGTKNLNEEQRAKFLENFEEFKNSHKQFSNQGQSNLCEDQSDVKNHFVAFIYLNGNLVELDGLVNGPYIVKEGIQHQDLLDATIEELRKRLENNNITENLAIMYLTKN
jgi:ubiquitin carboxyl-terminal hydrolase L3